MKSTVPRPPRPMPPSSIGIAQQDAAPKAAAAPPTANAIGPIASSDARRDAETASELISSGIGQLLENSVAVTLHSVVATDSSGYFRRRTVDRPTSITIGTLSRRTGCKVETVRYYERVGLMPPAPRTAGR